MEYRNTVPLEKRRKDVERVTKKHPGKVAIYINGDGNPMTPMIDRCKFLIPAESTMGYVHNVLRRRLEEKGDGLHSTMGLVVFIEEYPGHLILPPQSKQVGLLQKEVKSQWPQNEYDGMIYVTYSVESTFGSSSGRDGSFRRSLTSPNTRFSPSK